MTYGEMIKNMEATKITMVFVCFLIFSFGNMTLWAILTGVLTLLVLFYAFRMGQGAGHEACGSLKSLNKVIEDGRQPDALLLKKSWSKANMTRAFFGAALLGYIINCAYIIIMLVCKNENVLFLSRFLSYLCILPYWPILTAFHATYDVLTWDIVLLQMLSPFILPGIYYVGYLQGPKLWAKTEKAMAEGKRRAKARSRVVKKKKRPTNQPEI